MLTMTDTRTMYLTEAPDSEELILRLSETAAINLSQSPYQSEGLGIVLLGNQGCGKSNAMAVLAEEAHRQTLPFIFFDPGGRQVSLRELGDDVIVIGNDKAKKDIFRAHYPLSLAIRDAKHFISMVLNEGFSLVVDLRLGDNPERGHAAFQALLNEHYKQADDTPTPCIVLVDEAHNVAPQMQATEEEKISLKVIGRAALEGRKKGIMLIVSTQRPTYLHKQMIFGANVRLFGKVTYEKDYKSIIAQYLPIVSFGQIRALRSGEMFVVAENIFPERNLGKIRFRLRHTTDLGGTPLVNFRKRERPSLGQLKLPMG